MAVIPDFRNKKSRKGGWEEDWNNIVKMATFQCVWLGPKLENCSQIDSHESRANLVFKKIPRSRQTEHIESHRLSLPFLHAESKKWIQNLFWDVSTTDTEEEDMIYSKKLCVRMCWCMMKYGWCVTFLLIKRRENSNIQFFFIYFLHAIFSLWSWQGHGESRILIDPCQNLIMMTTIYKKILFQRICNKYGGKNVKQKERQQNN